MVEERRRLRSIQEMRNQQSEIGWMLLWCPLRDVLEVRLSSQSLVLIYSYSLITHF